MDRWVVPIDRASKNKDMTAKQISEIAALSPTLKYLLVKAFACKAKCYKLTYGRSLLRGLSGCN